MKIRNLAGIALLAVGMVGCSVNGRFYPVRGPLSTESTPRVLEGKFTAHLHAKTLTVDLKLSDSERATGTLVMVFPPSKRADKPLNSLSSQWDIVYGQGSYVATVLGQGQDARGVLTGTSGTHLDVEVHYDEGVRQLKGVAEDSNGNIYKIGFYR